MIVGVLLGGAVNAAAIPRPEPKPYQGNAQPQAATGNKKTTPHTGDISDGALKDIERQLEASHRRQKKLTEQAQKLASDVAILQKELIDAAKKAQDSEEDLSSLEDRVTELRTQEKTLQDDLGTRDGQLREVLMALERLALRPPESVLVQPVPAEDSIRSAILLGAAVPELADKAKALRDELDRLRDVRNQLSLRRTDIALTAAKLKTQNARLAILLKRKKALRQSTEQEREQAARRADSLARDASSMRDLLARLEAERKQRQEEERLRQEAKTRKAARQARLLAGLVVAKPAFLQPSASLPDLSGSSKDRTGPGAKSQVALVQTSFPSLRPIKEVRGLMPLPVRGRIVARYGQDKRSDSTREGIKVRSRAHAQVIAPADGVVAFAGPFRGYGLLLIIEHDGGYHTLLSGLGRMDVTVGQRLLMGEPVGVMGSEDAPELYLELRRNGQPINPMPWLTPHKG